MAGGDERNGHVGSELEVPVGTLNPRLAVGRNRDKNDNAVTCQHLHFNLKSFWHPLPQNMTRFHTKQTAKKSTGGFAPHALLPLTSGTLVLCQSTRLSHN